MITMYLILGAVFLFLALSPYYRMTALILAASCGVYALIQPFTNIESGLIYTVYVLLDCFVLMLILKWGDEGKLRQSLLLGSIAFFNGISGIDYYTYGLLNQTIIGMAINCLTIMQVGVMSDGIWDAFGSLRRGLAYTVESLQNGVRNNRTDP